MPYTASTAPDWVKGLPAEARDAWIKAYNAAYDQYQDEGKAAATASSQIKKMGYKKMDDEWVKAEEGSQEWELTGNTVGEGKDATGGDPEVIGTAEGIATSDVPVLTRDDAPAEKDNPTAEAEWDTAYINDLPDSAFAHIDPDGEKDEDGKTTPRSLRHLPHHDASGKVDPAHLRNALSRLSQTQMADDAKSGTESHLRHHARGMDMGEAISSLPVRALVEAIGVSEATIDGDTLRGVVILSPGWSVNGRYYSTDAIASSLQTGVWEGMKAFGNHDLSVPSRSIWEQIGYYSNYAIDEGGRLRADLTLVGDQAKKDHIREWAKASIAEGQPFLGVSIVAMAETEKGTVEGREGIIVKNIVSGRSIDVVSAPALDTGFHLLAADEGNDLTLALLSSLSYDQWRDTLPDYATKLREELKAVRQDTAIKDRDTKISTLSEDTRQLQDRVGELEETLSAKDTELETVREELAQVQSYSLAAERLHHSRLPVKLHEDVLPSLLGHTREEMEAIIEAEVAKVEKIAQPPAAVGVGQPQVTALAESFTRGVFGFTGPSPLPGESAEEYKERRGRETQT